MFMRFGRWSQFLTILLACSCRARGAEPAAIHFRAHALDAKNTYSAAAAIDVNRDGKLDIVTGGLWYEAPTWKKHTVREVEYIRGRFDDYSCLPLDVNADGFTDFLVSNYRSEKIAWVEHPGAKIADNKDAPWTEHIVEKPGPMETGRLADVDGDGKLDLLPNGRDFAAWWEIVPPAKAGGEPKFVRHELPAEIVGHGVGSGDVNGDGRPDLVGPNGWLEAPKDVRKDRWNWHAEFALDRDASMPILIHDVDGDSDADLIWGRGHRTGLVVAGTVTGRRQADLDAARDRHLLVAAAYGGTGRSRRRRQTRTRRRQTLPRPRRQRPGRMGPAGDLLLPLSAAIRALGNAT